MISVGHRGDQPVLNTAFLFVCAVCLQYSATVACLCASVPFQVPRGHVWLEGDNLENSSDSRAYGPVPYGLLRSRVLYKVNLCFSQGGYDFVSLVFCWLFCQRFYCTQWTAEGSVFGAVSDGQSVVFLFVYMEYIWNC